MTRSRCTTHNAPVIELMRVAVRAIGVVLPGAGVLGLVELRGGSPDGDFGQFIGAMALSLLAARCGLPLTPCAPGSDCAHPVDRHCLRRRWRSCARNLVDGTRRPAGSGAGGRGSLAGTVLRRAAAYGRGTRCGRRCGRRRCSRSTQAKARRHRWHGYWPLEDSWAHAGRKPSTGGGHPVIRVSRFESKPRWCLVRRLALPNRHWDVPSSV